MKSFDFAPPISDCLFRLARLVGFTNTPPRQNEGYDWGKTL